MNQYNRFCQFQKHEEYNAAHICCYDKCKLPSRWLCSQCFNEQIHNHDQPNIKDRSQFISQFQKDYDKLRCRIQQQQAFMLEQLKTIIEQIKEFKNVLDNIQLWTQEAVQCYLKYDKQLLNYFIEFQTIPFNNLGNYQINEILQIDSLDIVKYLDIEGILKKSSDLPTIYQKFQYSLNQMKENYLQNSKEIKYELQDLVKLKKQGNYRSPQISLNGRYVIYGQDFILKIYNTDDQSTYKLQLDSSINICRFSQNYEKLYVGCQSGNIYIMDFCDGIRISKGPIFVHNRAVKNIIELSNSQLITSSEDGSIIKFDIDEKEIVQKITAHLEWTHCLDYIPQRDLIISASDDKSIKCWEGLSLTNLLDKQNAHDSPIRQLQLIKNNLQLLTLDELGNLKQWQFQFETKDLILINHMQDENMLKCYSFQNDQLLVQFTQQSLKILNYEWEAKQVIQISEKLLNYPNEDSVQITATGQVIVMFKGNIQVQLDKIQILKPRY